MERRGVAGVAILFELKRGFPAPGNGSSTLRPIAFTDLHFLKSGASSGLFRKGCLSKGCSDSRVLQLCISHVLHIRRICSVLFDYGSRIHHPASIAATHFPTDLENEPFTHPIIQHQRQPYSPYLQPSHPSSLMKARFIHKTYSLGQSYELNLTPQFGP